MIFPPTGCGAFTVESFKDAGESEAYRSGGYGGWRIVVEPHVGSVLVRIRSFGVFRKLDPEPDLILRESEMRAVSVLRS